METNNSVIITLLTNVEKRGSEIQSNINKVGDKVDNFALQVAKLESKMDAHLMYSERTFREHNKLLETHTTEIKDLKTKGDKQAGAWTLSAFILGIIATIGGWKIFGGH